MQSFSYINLGTAVFYQASMWKAAAMRNCLKIRADIRSFRRYRQNTMHYKKLH